MRYHIDMELVPLDDTREELRTQFLAVLHASRELDPRIDGQLADVFVDHVDAVYRRGRQPVTWRPRRFLGPLIAGVAFLSFLLGASVPALHGDRGFDSDRVAPIYGPTQHFWNGPDWHGPPDRGADPGGQF